MNNHSNITTQKIVLTALLAALTVVGSSLRIVIPLDIGGNTAFHLGNIMCALAGLLLGPWYGGLAAGLGSALYDCLNPLYISEAWITFLTKGALGLTAGLVAITGKKNWSYGKAALASAAGAITYAVLYLAKSYFYSGLLIKGLSPDAALISVVGKLPATIFNAVIAIIAAPILGVAIRNALVQSNIALPQAEKVSPKTLRRSIAAALCLIAVLLSFKSFEAVSNQEFRDARNHYEEHLQSSDTSPEAEKAEDAAKDNTVSPAGNYQEHANEDMAVMKTYQTKAATFGVISGVLFVGAVILVIKKEK